MIKPIIGITPSIEDNFIKLNQNYCKALHEAGAVCIMLSYCEKTENIIDILDGVLLSGGGDISEKFLNEKLHPKANTIYPFRDEFEIELCNMTYQIDMPLLGICRGMQVLSLADGGGINQHILGHNQIENRNITTHNVAVKKESNLFNILNDTLIPVNSFHHQAVNKIGSNMLVSAYSQDGFIEAVEDKNQKFRIGVQWHPESLYNNYSQHFQIFKEFVKYAIDFKTKNKVY